MRPFDDPSSLTPDQRRAAGRVAKIGPPWRQSVGRGRRMRHAATCAATWRVLEKGACSVHDNPSVSKVAAYETIWQ